VRDTFLRELTVRASFDDSIFLVVGDLGFGVIDEFAEKYPARFLNAGISEQNMLGVSAGLAKTGYKVFVYSIANFPTMRCYEQIRNDICYHNLDVTVVSIGAGFGYGTLGYSHFAIEDLSIMRVLPNIRVLSPADPLEIAICLDSIIESGGPNYLRLGKNGEKNLLGELAGSPLTPRELNGGRDFALLVTGNIGKEVEMALNLIPANLKNKIGFFSIACLVESALTPIDLSQFSRVMTVEEHVLDGGFGSFVLEFLEKANIVITVKRVGIERGLELPVGNQEYLREFAGIDARAIANAMSEFFTS